MIRLSDTAFDPSEELRVFTAQADGAGAIVSFTGLVRGEAASGPVTGLTLQAYSPMTERGIENAAETATSRWPVSALCVVHRVGNMGPGEPIVFVAAASAHRRAAFEAADFLMDYLKTEAVFWKKETGPDGEIWIEPRADDYADASRWTKEQTS